jgi:hypothetical protein
MTPIAGSAQAPAVSGDADLQARVARADAAWRAGDKRAAEAEYALIVAADPDHSRAVYRLAELRRERDPEGAIALFRRYVALEPRDAWGHLALGQALAVGGDFDGSRAAFDAALAIAPRERDVHVERARMLSRAGYAHQAARAFERWLAISPDDAESRRELARACWRAAGWVEPMVGGTRDSDGIATWTTAVGATSRDLGRARFLASVGGGAAADATASRGFQSARIGATLRPTATSIVEATVGAQQLDRTSIDGGAAAPASRLVPVGRARWRWRDVEARWRFDARASREVLDVSPQLVAQGVRRDDVGAEIDVRLAGPLRARVFGRAGSVGNETESNERRIVGGAVAFAPAAIDLSLRAQELSYGGPTSLPYFAPRYARTVELTGYLERELGDALIALDAGLGAQQVAAWATTPGSWAPAGRLWMQLARPLTTRMSVGAEGELYDARIGTDVPSLDLPEGRWRYGSLRLWLRASF